MKNRMIWLAGVLLFPTILQAQVQWLGYRTADNARDIVGGSAQYLSVDEGVPAGLELPEMACDQPLHFRWNTKMDSAGFRRIVLDKKHKYGLYDVLYIDADGDGKLTNETKYEGRQDGQYEVWFNTIPVVFKGEDGPITYHLNLRFYGYEGSTPRIYAYPGCWYEGKARIGDKETRCVLVDYNCNGTFNDKSEDFNCDRVLVGPEENYHQGYVGNFIELDGALYRFSAAQDGAFLEFTPAPEVAYGVVTMPEAITTVIAGGINGRFERKVEKGQAKLPVGMYRLYSWDVERKDAKGDTWRLNAYAASRRLDFEVSADGPASLDIGEPIISRLEAEQRDGTYYLNQALAGRGGESITLYGRNGGRASAPKVHVRNQTGEYDRTFSLEYG